MDNDEDIDILGAAMNGNQIALWYNDGQNPITWTKQIIDGSFGWARSVYAADVNGDNLIDILGAAYTANTIAVWYNNGDSTWTNQIVDNGFSGAHRAYAFDLDKDNKTDILGAAYSGDQIAWWRNEGGNPVQWTKQIIDGAFDGAISVYTCDIDNDGDNDVVGAAEFSGKVALWINESDSPISWTKQIISNNFAGAWGIHAEDIDGDNDPDVLSGASVANDVTWWENNGIVGIKENETRSILEKSHLFQNFPNPFNPTTTVEYNLSEVSMVLLKVYDLLGQEIITLVDELQSSGKKSIEWDGTDISGKKIGSGIYIYCLQADNQIQSKKMVVIK